VNVHSPKGQSGDVDDVERGAGAAPLQGARSTGVTKCSSNSPSCKNAPKTRGRPFAKGNPGRPKGSRHRVTRAVEDLLEGEAEKLTRKAIDLALGGDTTALRLCLERISPPRKSRPITVKLPPVATAEDVAQAQSAVINAAAAGLIDLNEAVELAGLLESKRRSLETQMADERIKKLEEIAGAKR